jgi:hypothetical protein
METEQPKKKKSKKDNGKQKQTGKHIDQFISMM